VKARVVLDDGATGTTSHQNLPPPPPPESWIPPFGLLLLLINIERETAEGSVKLPK
jgi:hypothetical protein